MSFEAINRRKAPVELVVDGASKGELHKGQPKTFSAPQGEIWEARRQGITVATYEVSPRVETWTIPPARVGLPVPLTPVHSGPYNESLKPSSEIRFLAGTGKLNAVMLFVDFQDVRASGQSWADENDIAAHVVGEAEKEIKEASFGALELTVDAQHGWRDLSKSVKDYTDQNCRCVVGHMGQYIEEVVGLYSKVDFSSYDIVYIVAAKSDDFSNSPAWSARDYEVITTPSGEVRHAVTFGKDSYWPDNKTFLLLHETYHLLGLPDLYDGGEVAGKKDSYSDAGLREWDLMADEEAATSLLGWHRLKLGWLHSSQVVCFYDTGSLELDLADWSGPDGVKAVMVPVTVDNHAENAHLAYVVEVANPKEKTGNDGVLVYSVNTALPPWERPIQMRGGDDALSAESLSVGSSYSHFSGVYVEVLNRLSSGGFRVRVEKRS